MKHGFIKCAALLPEIKVADTKFNSDNIIKLINEADSLGVNLAVFPELCVTGSSCKDLFFNETLLESAKQALIKIAESTAGKLPVCVVGLPIKYSNKIYNCAAVVFSGEILALVPKTHSCGIFSSAEKLPDAYNRVSLGNDIVPLGKKFVFKNLNSENFSFGVELSSDTFAPCPPSVKLCGAGANIIACPAALPETPLSQNTRNLNFSAQSLRLGCGYVFANAFCGESTAENVFAGHSIITENGVILSENPPFSQNNIIVTEIDVNALSATKGKINFNTPTNNYSDILFDQPLVKTKLTRHIPKNPFLPQENKEIYLEKILTAQAFALKKRLEHTGLKTMVIGVSGGLDSSLALLALVNAADLCKIDRKNIIAVTMPCFGTTNRTKNNAEKLCELLGVTLKHIDIKASVLQHFKDIGHNPQEYTVTYENAQARERTQILMDIANAENGLVIGTGDLSELALGFATYNGDQMSMYGINSSIPKTLVRALTAFEAERLGGEIKTVLTDILETPVSPELLPNESGNISQITEDLVGPYELHDFFLYYTVKFGFSPAKIFKLAGHTFKDSYQSDTILKWLKVFYKRFFASQFKRSCMPDGAKLTEISLSPTGDLKMPSDTSAAIWLNELEEL